MDGDDDLVISGTQPALEGLQCEAVVAVQFWHEGRLEEGVNAAHLKFGGVWHRLFFDHGIVYWRLGEGPPQGFEAAEIQASYCLDDIGRRHGLIGSKVESIGAVAGERGSRVVLRFQRGITLTFFDHDDRSDYEFSETEPY